jgi:hypothetical protein
VVRIEERAAERPNARVSGDRGAWIAALSPEHDRTGLKLTGDRQVAQRLLDALVGGEADAAIVRAPEARAA